jgi:parallel beta-helix repeat protein
MAATVPLRVESRYLHERYKQRIERSINRRRFLSGLGCVGLGVVLGGVLDTRGVFATGIFNSSSPTGIGPSYTVFTDAADGNLVKAVNNNTGTVDSSGPDAASVIQYAISALKSPGKITLQPGTYTVSKSLLSNGANGVELCGEGDSTVLRLADNTNSEVVYLESVKDWYIHDLQIDGSKTKQASNSQYSDGIHGYGCTNLVLENNFIHDCLTYGLCVGAGVGCQVLNNRVVNSGANGITIANGDGGGTTLVQGNTVNGASDVGITTWTGIGVTISNNTVTNVINNDSPYGINSHIGIMQEQSSQKITVINNSVQGCDEGLSNAPDPGQLNTDVTWQGNEIAGCAKAMCVNNAARTVISGNQITGATIKGINVGSQASDVQITGNTLQDITGISAIEGAANGLLVKGNIINRIAGDCIVAWGYGNWIVTGNNMNSTSNRGCGVLLGAGATAGSSNWNVTQNTIIDCAGDGIRVGGPSSYNTVNGNTVSGCATGVNINSAQGRNNVVSSNIFEGNTTPLIDNGTGTVKTNNVITTMLVRKR